MAFEQPMAFKQTMAFEQLVAFKQTRWLLNSRWLSNILWLKAPETPKTTAPTRHNSSGTVYDRSTVLSKFVSGCLRVIIEDNTCHRAPETTR